MGPNASDWSPASAAAVAAAWRLIHGGGGGVEHLSASPSPVHQAPDTNDDDDAGDEPLNRVVKLLMLSAVASVASVGNIFVISAVLMDEHLKKRGNVFVVNMALADLTVSGVSIPAATVGLLANLTDWRLICQIQWSALVLVSFVTAPSLAAAAADLRLQIGVGPDRYLGLVTLNRLGIILFLIWLSSAAGLGAFVALDLGPDVCHGSGAASGWSWPLPLAITSVQVLWPVALAAVVHLCSVLSVRSTKLKSPPYLVPPYDASLVLSSVSVYVLFVICWTPLLVASAVGVSRALPMRLFKQLQWLAMAKSCLNPFVYAACSKHYRDAFVTLYFYCCCKTSVSFSRRVRADSLRPHSDVRVHMIPGYNVYSAVAQGPLHRATASTVREPAAGLKPTSRPLKVAKMSKCGPPKKSKEVYEL